MRVSYGPPGHKGVTHLVAVGGYEQEFATNGILDWPPSIYTEGTQTLWVIGIAGLVGYWLGRRTRR